MPAVLMFTYGNLMHVGHRSAVLCLLLTLLGFVLTLHRTGNDFINLTGNCDFVTVNMSEELSRSRAACRGWVTRECKNLATTLEDPELNVVKLSAAMDEFDKRLTNLDDVQSRYELSLENEDAILNDITTAADFRDSARKVRTLASEKFKELSGDSGNKSATHVSSFSVTDVKLPKLNLPVFNGDVLQWQSFWDQFVAAVDSTDLPDVSKFSYLRASLEGEPKAAIQGLSLTSAHYASACKILKDRFGRKETIIFTHIQKLLNLSVPSKCSVSALWKLNDDLQAHTRSLATLGIDGDKYGVILTPLILSRVPQELRLEWSRDGKGHESDLKFLLSFLEKEIQRRERSQMFQESLGPSFKSSVEERRPRVATASALQATSTVNRSRTTVVKGTPSNEVRTSFGVWVPTCRRPHLSICLQKSQRILPRFLFWESFNTSFAKIRNRKWENPPTGNPIAGARHIRNVEFFTSFQPDFCMLMINGIRGNKIDIVRPKLRMLR